MYHCEGLQSVRNPGSFSCFSVVYDLHVMDRPAGPYSIQDKGERMRRADLTLSGHFLAVTQGTSAFIALVELKSHVPHRVHLGGHVPCSNSGSSAEEEEEGRYWGGS